MTSLEELVKQRKKEEGWGGWYELINGIPSPKESYSYTSTKVKEQQMGSIRFFQGSFESPILVHLSLLLEIFRPSIMSTVNTGRRLTLTL